MINGMEVKEEVDVYITVKKKISFDFQVLLFSIVTNTIVIMFLLRKKLGLLSCNIIMFLLCNKLFVEL